MPSAFAHEEFVAFMAEYTSFLAVMCADEKRKMCALAGRGLLNIEQGIAKSQANAKQLANLEIKRAALQDAAGFGGMTFKQLIDAAPKDMQQSLWQLFNVFERHVSNIKFYNDKSMAIARDNMVEVDPEAVLNKRANPNNPYEKLRGKHAGAGLLETKV